MKNNVLISKMTKEDLNSIANILQSDFDDFWNYNILSNELNSSNSIYLVAKINDEIIGFAGLTLILDEAEINNIVIKKDFRKNGYSKILLQNLIDLSKKQNIKKINLEVNIENIIAINLYHSFNFKDVGLRKRYYKEKDAILMSLFI